METTRGPRLSVPPGLGRDSPRDFGGFNHLSLQILGKLWGMHADTWPPPSVVWDTRFGRGMGTSHRDQQQEGNECRQTKTSQNHRNSSRLGQVHKALMCRETTPFLDSFPACPSVDKPLAHRLGVQTPPCRPLAKLLWGLLVTEHTLAPAKHLPAHFSLKISCTFPWK